MGGGGHFFPQKLFPKKPNIQEYVQDLVVTCPKLNSVTALLSPPLLSYCSSEALTIIIPPQKKILGNKSSSSLSLSSSWLFIGPPWCRPCLRSYGRKKTHHHHHCHHQNHQNHHRHYHHHHHHHSLSPPSPPRMMIEFKVLWEEDKPVPFLLVDYISI